MGKLVWLASYPKSGNTWLRMFLHNYIAQPDSPYSINKLADFSAVECSAAAFGAHDPRPASALSPEEVQRLRPAVHKDLTKLHDDLVFVKTHNANLALHGVAFCTPELTAGAIYLVRDPRDIAVSYAAYTGLGIDAVIDFMSQPGAANRGTALQVFELLSSWSAHVESWNRNKRHLVLRYEDMIARPAQVFGKIVHFLGDDPNPTRLNQAIAFSRFENLAAQERETGYAGHAAGAKGAFFRTGQAGQWREHLTAEQTGRIDAAHGQVMQRFGYLT
jgi:hypothetical protein